MTYAEAKTLVGSGKFVATYSRLGQSIKRFQCFYDNGPYASTDYHQANSTASFDYIKSWDEPFKSGTNNIFLELVENYESQLDEVAEKVSEYLLEAIGYCRSIRSGMDIDTVALADALAKEEEEFNKRSPHKRTIYDNKGNAVGTEDTTAEDRAAAFAEGEKVWQAECCVWSK